MTQVKFVVLVLCLSLVATEKTGAAAGKSKKKPYAELSTFALQATDAIVTTACGKKADARWNEVGGKGDGLNTTSPETVKAFRSFGKARVMMTVVELNAVRREDADGPSNLQTSVAVFPDGHVAWVIVVAKSGATDAPTRGLKKSAPALAHAVDQMTAALAGKHCMKFPMMSTGRLTELPEKPRRDEATKRLAKTCVVMHGYAKGWKPRIDRVSVVVQSGDRFGQLLSTFEQNGAHLSLSRVRFIDR